MARCGLSDKKVKRLQEQTGLDIAQASVRGGNDHAILLYLNGGKCAYLLKDGTIKFVGRWRQDKIATRDQQKLYDDYKKAEQDISESISKIGKTTPSQSPSGDWIDIPFDGGVAVYVIGVDRIVELKGDNCYLWLGYKD